MQSLKKIGEKLLKLESRNDIFTSIKAHNSVVCIRILPFCNPKPLLNDIKQSLKKLGLKLLKLESGNEAVTDGRSNILGLWATSKLNSHREVAPKM